MGEGASRERVRLPQGPGLSAGLSKPVRNLQLSSFGVNIRNPVRFAKGARESFRRGRGAAQRSGRRTVGTRRPRGVESAVSATRAPRWESAYFKSVSLRIWRTSPAARRAM